MEGNCGRDASHWAENRQGGYRRDDSWVFNVHLGLRAGAGSQGDFRQGRRKQTWKGRRKEEVGCQVL